MAQIPTSMFRPVRRQDVMVKARQFAYLGSIDRIKVALANEFSPDTPLPSKAAIQGILDARARKSVRAA